MSLKSKFGVLRHMLDLQWKARRHGRELAPVQDNTASITRDDILLFCTLRNELVRIPFFLEYYRSLGVKHFLFVDNDSSDGFRDHVAGMGDVSVWHTNASYRESAFGMHWLNYLLHRYGCGRWCVVCDPDEFLVYPHCGSRDLAALAAQLEQGSRSSMFALMLDMYADYIDSGMYAAGGVPWQACPWFDRSGYRSTNQTYWHNLHVMGGPRARLFYSPGDGDPPALNKVPFVRWKRHYNYVSSMHNLSPRRPNAVFGDDDITGCLLHFKFISSLAEKSREELQRGEHYDNSSEYRKYDAAVSERRLLYAEGISERYRDWRQLVELRLMNPGPWWK